MDLMSLIENAFKMNFLLCRGEACLALAQIPTILEQTTTSLFSPLSACVGEGSGVRGSRMIYEMKHLSTPTKMTRDVLVGAHLRVRPVFVRARRASPCPLPNPIMTWGIRRGAPTCAPVPLPLARKGEHLSDKSLLSDQHPGLSRKLQRALRPTG